MLHEYITICFNRCNATYKFYVKSCQHAYFIFHFDLGQAPTTWPFYAVSVSRRDALADTSLAAKSTLSLPGRRSRAPLVVVFDDLNAPPFIISLHCWSSIQCSTVKNGLNNVIDELPPTMV